MSSGDADGSAVPKWTYVLGGAILAATSACIVAAYWYADSSFGSFSSSVGVPALGLAVGAWLTDFYYRRDSAKRTATEVKKSTYTTLSLLTGVEKIDQSLSEASDKMNEGRNESARTDVAAAIATANMSLVIANQSLREWETLSSTAVAEARRNFEADRTQIGERQQIRRGTGS